MPKAKNDKRPGTVIPDNKLIAIWKCPKCGHEADIPPTFYENSGNPICDQFDECEGCEMTYVETRLLKRPL